MPTEQANTQDTNFPQPRMVSSTRTQDWQIGGQQDAAAKVQTVFAGQETLPSTTAPSEPESETVFPTVGTAPDFPAASTPTPAAPATPPVAPNGGRLPRRTDNGHSGGHLGGRYMRSNIFLGVGGAVLAVVFLAILLRYAQQAQDKREASSGLTDFASYGIEVLPACTNSVSAFTREQIDALVERYTSEYVSVPVDEDYQRTFDYFFTPARVATGRECLDSSDYCRQEFGDNRGFQISVIANYYASNLDYAVGQRLDAATFRLRRERAFGGGEAADLSLDESLSYDASDDTFGVPVPVESTSPYRADLVDILLDPEENETVFVAEWQPDGECAIEVRGERCSCPSARYYLVMRYDEEADHWIYAEHFVQPLSELQPLDANPDESSTN